MTGFPDAVEGFVPHAYVPIAWKGGTGAEGTSPNTQLVIGQRLRSKKRIAKNEADFLKQHAPGPFKITLPSPVNFAVIFWRRSISAGAYPTPGDFLTEAASILASEARALAKEGTPYIQLDAPVYTHWADPSLTAKYQQAGFDLDHLLSEAITSENTILDAPAPATTGVHLCRGNSMGRWLADGGYDKIAEKLFNELRCDRLLLEYDSPRAGDFAPLRFVPKNKIVVLGLITTKHGELETADEIARRVDEAARYLLVEQLALSPQCGFASSGRENPLTEEESSGANSSLFPPLRRLSGNIDERHSLPTARRTRRCSFLLGRRRRFRCSGARAALAESEVELLTAGVSCIFSTLTIFGDAMDNRARLDQGFAAEFEDRHHPKRVIAPVGIRVQFLNPLLMMRRHEFASDAVDGCAGRPAKGRRWKSVTVKEPRTAPDRVMRWLFAEGRREAFTGEVAGRVFSGRRSCITSTLTSCAQASSD